MHTIACFSAPCRAARSITVLLGNGNGTFQTPIEIDVGTGPMAMAVLAGEFNWPVNPQNITVRSNFGGQATRAATAR
jgi:hypothetical protein